MAEQKEIATFTEAKVQEDNSCIIETSFDDGLSEIHSVQTVSVDPKDDQIENITFPGISGYGVGTVNESKVPSDLSIEVTLNGSISISGVNANKYDIDQNTGHLIFTEP